MNQGRENIFQETSNFTGSVAGFERPARQRHDQLFPIFWRQRWIIIVCTLLGIALGVAYLFLATPVYTSTARMKVVPAMGRMVGEQSLSDSVNANYLQTESDLIQSPVVLALALQTPEVKPLVPSDADPIQFLQKSLGVDPGKHETVITVSFSSTDRFVAATMANAIVKAYQKYSVTPKQSTAGDVDLLQGNLRDLDTQIKAARASMTRISQQYGALDPTNPLSSMAERQLDGLLKDLSAAQRQATAAEVYNQAALRALAELRAKGVDVDAVDVDVIGVTPETQANIANEINTLKQMQGRWMANHPQYISIEQRLNKLRAMQAKIAQSQYDLAKANENLLSKQVEEARKQVKDVGLAAQQYSEYQSQLANAEKSHERYQQKLSEILTARELGVYQIDIFEEARPELKPSHPNKKTTLPIGMILGLMLGCGVGFLRDWKDDRFRTVQEIKETLDVPLLGTIPRMPEGMPAPLAGQQAMLEPASAVAEACRSVRTAIYFGAPEDRCRTIHVTSPASADGKSTLAANLAITMAQAGKRVLLIDADLRVPTQHTIFGIRNDSGLGTILTGKDTLDQAIQPSAVSGLEVLPSGPKPSHPTEILNSAMFNELLEVLAERFDQVIIDSPPVMGTADSRIIAASCDITVMVLRAEKSTRRISEMARDALNSVGANLLGIIINQMDSSDVSYGYYSQKRLKSPKMAGFAAN